MATNRHSICRYRFLLSPLRLVPFSIDPPYHHRHQPLPLSIAVAAAAAAASEQRSSNPCVMRPDTEIIHHHHYIISRQQQQQQPERYCIAPWYAPDAAVTYTSVWDWESNRFREMNWWYDDVDDSFLSLFHLCCPIAAAAAAAVCWAQMTTDLLYHSEIFLCKHN